jgi:hypothetical protein
VLATLLEILGFAFVVTGAALVSVPLAFVTAGMLLIVAALALDSSRRRART